MHPRDVDTDQIAALGERVRALRLAKGWVQVDLKVHADVDLSSLQKLEQGKAKQPPLDLVLNVARALGVTVEELVGREAPAASLPPAFARFLEGPTGQSVKPQERAALEMVAAHPPQGRAITAAYLEAVLAAMRGFLAPHEVAPAADDSDAIDRGEFGQN